MPDEKFWREEFPTILSIVMSSLGILMTFISLLDHYQRHRGVGASAQG